MTAVGDAYHLLAYHLLVMLSHHLLVMLSPIFTMWHFSSLITHREVPFLAIRALIIHLLQYNMPLLIIPTLIIWHDGNAYLEIPSLAI